MRSWIRKAVAAYVIVHTTDDRTIEGVLELDARDGLVLAGAKYVETQNKVPLEGDTFIPRHRVAFIQRPHAEALT